MLRGLSSTSQTSRDSSHTDKLLSSSVAAAGTVAALACVALAGCGCLIVHDSAVGGPRLAGGDPPVGDWRRLTRGIRYGFGGDPSKLSRLWLWPELLLVPVLAPLLLPVLVSENKHKFLVLYVRISANSRVSWC